MMTLQHVALYTMALAEKRRITVNSYNVDLFSFYQELDNEIPWLLLPDGIRFYVGARQPSHFEELPDETGVSWIKYPDEYTLKTLSKEDAKANLRFSLPETFPKCVIGEETNLPCFDRHNWSHKHRVALRCHLVQDCHFDACLRQGMVDVTDRFNDSFKIIDTEKIIDGATLRKQIKLFEELGFIKLVGSVFEKTGMLLNRPWFDKHVFHSLQKAYPEDLARSTYKYMAISDEVNDRINNLDFEITDAEKSSIELTNYFDNIIFRKPTISSKVKKQHSKKPVN